MSDKPFEMYRATRSEILERIKLRDQIILGYLAGVTALIAAAIVKNSTAVLLTIPVMAIGTTVIICQHQVALRALSKYMVNELIPRMPKDDSTEWESSQARNEYRPYTDMLRFGGYVVLLLGPCFAAFIFYRYEMWLGTKDGIDLQLQVLWVIDGLITIIVILVLHLTWIGTGKDRDMKAALPWLARHLLFQNERHTKECKIEASDQLSNVVSEDHRSVI